MTSPREKKIEKIDLEQFEGYESEMGTYRIIADPRGKMISEKINEIIDFLNLPKDK